MFSRQKSEKSITEYVDAIPRSLSYKYLGDVVDGTRYSMADYKEGLPRTCTLRTKKHPDLSTVDEVDNPDASGLNNKGSEVSFGFDLTSMTSLRGHFIDHVVSSSEAEKAGLQQGDMLLKVNDVEVKDMTHDDLVFFIKNASEESEALTMVVVSKVVETTVKVTTVSNSKGEE